MTFFPVHRGHQEYSDCAQGLRLKLALIYLRGKSTLGSSEYQFLRCLQRDAFFGGLISYQAYFHYSIIAIIITIIESLVMSLTTLKFGKDNVSNFRTVSYFA